MRAKRPRLNINLMTATSCKNTVDESLNIVVLLELYRARLESHIDQLLKQHIQ